jgi:16S rRNA (adenine1518-N6/adenine1519-N6)-dimethyltransferase
VTVRAKKELGQHFLVDENILGVIGRLAELDAGDVVLEIGPGLGVLTTFPRRPRAAGLRSRARPVARAATRRARGRAAERRTALRRRAAARPTRDGAGATKLVANLPYNVATPLVAESLDGLPDLQLWCVMVQREGRRPLLRLCRRRRRTAPCRC